MNSFEDAPLKNLRVLELGSTVAGPFCGRLLADFGAQVVKVEPAEGDALRTMGKQFEGKSLYAASLFRNKSLVCIDLHTSQGQDIARSLALDSDIVVENFRPGRLESWGLGYEQLSTLNPRLIMVRISGFGQSGPYSQRPGYGVVGEAVSGLRYLTGDPQSPPSRVAVSMTDYITGLYAAFGATLAVLKRYSSGRGQYIDAALYECAFSFMEPWVSAYEKLGHIPERTGSRLPESTPNNLYPTGDGQFIHITAMGDAVFGRLAGAMGQPELARDLRFASAMQRNSHYDEIDGLVARWSGGMPLAELESILQAAQVPATRIYTLADIFNDPHYRSRQSIVDVPDADLGSVAMAAVVPRLSDTPGVIRHSGRKIGQDTRAVLQERLGYSDEQIEALAGQGIIKCEGRGVALKEAKWT